MWDNWWFVQQMKWNKTRIPLVQTIFSLSQNMIVFVLPTNYLPSIYGSYMVKQPVIDMQNMVIWLA